MNRSFAIISALALATALSACDPLAVNPGADLAVQVLSQTPIELTQQVLPIDIEFEVQGCDSFELAVGRRTTAGVNDLNLTHRQQNDGTYVATVPVHWLVDTRGTCSYSEESPFETRAELSVRCLLDDRTVRSDSFDVRWAPAARAVWQGRGDVDHVFASSGGDQFFTLGAGWLAFFDGGEELGEDEAPVDASIAPRMLVDDARAFLFVGCPLPDCGLVQLGSAMSYTSAGYIYEISTEWDRLTVAPQPPLQVPRGVVDMAVDAQGDLVVLSRTTSAAHLMAFRGGEQPEYVEVAAAPVSKLAELADGRLGFLVHDEGDLDVRCLSSAGELVWTADMPGSGPIGHISLAPDGVHWSIIRGGRVWLGQRGTWAEELDTDIARFSDARELGLTWSAAAMAVFNEESVDLFAREQGAQRQYRHTVELLEEGGSRPRIDAVSVWGEQLVLTTYTGVRVLDSDGVLLGGLDPLPCNTPRTSDATVIGDGWVGIAFGDLVYLLDLKQM